MPPHLSPSAVRQSFRLQYPPAPLRTPPLLKSVNQQARPEPSSIPKSYACLFSSGARSLTRASLRPRCRGSDSNYITRSNRCSSAWRPTRPRCSVSSSLRNAPYSTSPASPSLQPDPALSTEQYHGQADAFIEALLVHLEQLQEERADVDCEYSVRPPSGRPPLFREPLSHSHLGRRLNPRFSPQRYLRAEQTTAQ